MSEREVCVMSLCVTASSVIERKINVLIDLVLKFTMYCVNY